MSLNNIMSIQIQAYCILYIEGYPKTNNIVAILMNSVYRSIKNNLSNVLRTFLHKITKQLQQIRYFVCSFLSGEGICKKKLYRKRSPGKQLDSNRIRLSLLLNGIHSYN